MKKMKIFIIEAPDEIKEDCCDDYFYLKIVLEFSDIFIYISNLVIIEDIIIIVMNLEDVSLLLCHYRYILNVSKEPTKI